MPTQKEVLECSVCLGVIILPENSSEQETSNLDVPAALSCGHIFHLKCIKSVRSLNVNFAKCPYCRAKFKLRSVKKLILTKSMIENQIIKEWSSPYSLLPDPNATTKRSKKKDVELWIEHGMKALSLENRDRARIEVKLAAFCALLLRMMAPRPPKSSHLFQAISRTDRFFMRLKCANDADYFEKVKNNVREIEKAATSEEQSEESLGSSSSTTTSSSELVDDTQRITIQREERRSWNESGDGDASRVGSDSNRDSNDSYGSYRSTGGAAINCNIHFSYLPYCTIEKIAFLLSNEGVILTVGKLRQRTY